MVPSLKVIDSHTGGEPTRIIVQGGPDLGEGSLADRVARFRNQFDSVRRAVVMEPRGSDVMVGGLLLEPSQPEATAGIIFFNNHDYLQMCGHGMIGLAATLKHLGKIGDGTFKIETPVGEVTIETEGHSTRIGNVPSYRLRKDVVVDVPQIGKITGDVAWGGNWFFLVKNLEEVLSVERVDHLIQLALNIRGALEVTGVTGAEGEWIDHIELFAPPMDLANQSRNFVLCPGGAYDRSPCGTGTSAKLACLAADGLLDPGELWHQESVIGSVFIGSYQNGSTSINGQKTILPSIEGTAYVNGECHLILNPEDPYCMGIET